MTTEDELDAQDAFEAGRISGRGEKYAELTARVAELEDAVRILTRLLALGSPETP